MSLKECVGHRFYLLGDHLTPLQDSRERTERAVVP